MTHWLNQYSSLKVSQNFAMFHQQNSSQHCKKYFKNVNQIFTNNLSLIFPLWYQNSYILDSFPLALVCFSINLLICIFFNCIDISQIYTKSNMMEAQRGRNFHVLFSVKLIKVSSQLSHFFLVN